jgi:hypothetical protein
MNSQEWMSWIEAFFNELEVYEDINNSCNYKQNLLDAIKTFLAESNEKNAEHVYFSFFDAYWIGDKKDNPFLELIKSVNQYEQTAGSLIKNHRDHYYHTVYVFLIGLIFYQNCDYIQKVFNDYIHKSKYTDYYTTKHEEFLYRWGITSLFHDVAYPLEITIKQLNEYYNYSVSYGEKSMPKKFLDIGGLDLYKAQHSFTIPEQYKEEFAKKYKNIIDLDVSDSCSLLAMDIARDLSLEKDILCNILSNYDQKISDGIIDHAYFGALICLKWHSVLINKSIWNPAYFYFPILDSASSIFLHNAYEHCIMKELRTNIKLDIIEKPIAFLLCLSDSLQEWNRKLYGKNTGRCEFFTAYFNFNKLDNKILIKYLVSEKENAKNIYNDIAKKLNLDNMPHLEISYKQVIKESV